MVLEVKCEYAEHSQTHFGLKPLIPSHSEATDTTNRVLCVVVVRTDQPTGGAQRVLNVYSA